MGIDLLITSRGAVRPGSTVSDRAGVANRAEQQGDAQPVAVDDEQRGAPWRPTFGALHRAGAGRPVAAPVLSVNIYSRDRGELGDEIVRDQALLLATHASLAVANTEAVRLTDLRETQLRRAIETRDVIGQAKGILMQRRGINADEAFGLLRRASQDLNVKLAELAQTLASRHTELDVPGR